MIEIRPATAGDKAEFRFVAEHDRETAIAPASIFEKDGDSVLVATVSGRFAGQVVYRDWTSDDGETYLYLFLLFVGPRWRNRSIGTQLLGAVEKAARERGLRGVILNVASRNTRARRLYERLGYVEYGKAENTWIATDGDAVTDVDAWMVKEITPFAASGSAFLREAA
jgi:ribosomal protein S18 acetylase RimI-like enzyme